MKTLFAILLIAVCYLLNGWWDSSYEMAPSEDEMNTAYIHTEDSL